MVQSHGEHFLWDPWGVAGGCCPSASASRCSLYSWRHPSSASCRNRQVGAGGETASRFKVMQPFQTPILLRLARLDPLRPDVQSNPPPPTATAPRSPSSQTAARCRCASLPAVRTRGMPLRTTAAPRSAPCSVPSDSTASSGWLRRRSSTVHSDCHHRLRTSP